MLSFDDAIELLTAALSPLGNEALPLTLAHNRRLAAPVFAAISSPRVTVSTMDGYAVADGDGDDAWSVVGTSWPGDPFVGTLAKGEAVRIFTGAPLPDGATRIIIQEQVGREGDRIALATQPGTAAWTRPAGSDFASGDEILPKGRILDARALVAAAGADVASVRVTQQPRVALIATGSELVPAGEAHRDAHAVPDSLTIGLSAMVGDWGGVMSSAALVPDHKGIITNAAKSALTSADVIVMIGGASVGERDFARGVWDALGMELLFARLAIRPGKPIWVGRCDGRWIVGLPGNPTSAMVTARLFLAPLLTMLCGGQVAEALHWREAALAGTLAATGERETFNRARRNADHSVSPLTNQDSGAQATLAAAHCLIRTRIGQAGLAAGGRVTVLDW
jgi:molybdopterin molybdotransferase